ncbi:MAG: hypothetical protein H0X66_14870 [Verrucomicrobia bacterium]|jgi:hypothetical protein|nr:hypothetical protein [Verrucomicrobiota bacterium]
MEPWKIVFDEAAFHLFTASSAFERRKLLDAFADLRTNPQRDADYEGKDAAGRILSVWAMRPFLITYWLDSFISEIRIVNIEKIKY